ncbi:hypothetical protein [Roseicitreum antarcticum]|uniref:Uncharacterized protein n=1 Tax=Roseicitreum antarcticum TaxID=564137 RepID=A0A1H2VVW4_9RHOB|nr:hypothetical protein [Roseicitreum antarcticum]SDW72009.1 hypothetical protein SAMN04488238_103179 [Roseicitreum antarcticum]
MLAILERDTRALRLLVNLNWDRIMFALIVLTNLTVVAWVLSQLAAAQPALEYPTYY